MIRTKHKKHGEVNDPNTVLSSSNLLPNKYIVGDNNKNIKLAEDAIPNSILYLSTHELKFFSLNEPNRLVGINTSGHLQLFSKVAIPNTAPSGRTEIAIISGSTTPSGSLNFNSIELIPGWYEVEVIGAGGGGGGGAALYDNSNFKDGKNGGRGGYYKTLFKIEEKTNSILQAGCSGGRGRGTAVVKDSKSTTYSGSVDGGTGGRTPTFYHSNAFPGQDAGSNSGDESLGGNGVHGGATGGYSKSPGNYNYNAGGGGGGANGPEGGNGGFYNATSAPNRARGGGGGGAGGGFGTGGSGGSAHIGNRSSSFGGGGGGGGLRTVPDYPASGGGGGGGGGSYFKCGELEIFCGGGGGGAGGGNASAGNYTEGGNGINNYNSSYSEDNTYGAPGIGGNGILINNASSGTTLSDGTNGGQGVVKLWRCE